MLQKITEAARIPLANIKGIITVQNMFNVGMQLVKFGTFIPLAAPQSIYKEIRHDFEKNEMAQGITLIAGGIITTGCIAYCKYLQMVPPKKANPETLPLINNSIGDDTKAKENQHSKSSEILHLFTGIVYIPADILLQLVAINKFFYHKFKINVPFYAYIPGTISLFIQDLRVLSQTTGTDNRSGKWLEDLKNTKFGLFLEAIAVLHRAAAAKGSFEQLSQSNEYLNYIHFLTYNPLSIIPRWTNNITQNNDNSLQSSALKCTASIFTFLFAFSYALEDATLYVYALPELSQLGPAAQLAFVGLLTLAETPVYAEKANIAGKWAIQKLSSCVSSIHSFFPEKQKLLYSSRSVNNVRNGQGTSKPNDEVESSCCFNH